MSAGARRCRVVPSRRRTIRPHSGRLHQGATHMPATASPAKPSPFAVFRTRSFTLLWTGQLISMIGSGMTTIAASILVYRVTGAALSVGLMLMAAALPGLAVGLLAGVFVDRWD